MKNEITFRFPVYDAIRNFLHETHTINFSIIPSENIVRCNCSEEDVELAIHKYKAEQLDASAGMSSGS